MIKSSIVMRKWRACVILRPTRLPAARQHGRHGSPATRDDNDLKAIERAWLSRGAKTSRARAGLALARERTILCHVKIATFNINGIRSRLPLLLQWLAKAKPDIVALQELKAPHDLFPEQALRAAGYGVIWLGERAYNGVAILARGSEPILIRKCLPGDPSDEASRYLEAAVNGIIVACLYLPNGNPQPGPRFAYKLAWFERLIVHARTLKKSGAPVVLLGDFNVVPTEADIYETTSYDDDALLQPESRAAYRDLLKQGWTDSIRHLYPKKTIYTFWDYFRRRWERNAGLRIDHILLSPSLAPQLASAGVDTWVRAEPHPSDHAPVWVKLTLPPAAKKGTARKVAKKKAPAKKKASPVAKAAKSIRR
jgi:exodeoxyribonuclease-3